MITVCQLCCVFVLPFLHRGIKFDDILSSGILYGIHWGLLVLNPGNNFGWAQLRLSPQYFGSLASMILKVTFYNNARQNQSFFRITFYYNEIRVLVTLIGLVA